MPAPIFEFFEVVVDELTVHTSSVITPDSLKAKDKDSSLVDDLKRDLKAQTSRLPFDFQASTALFVATDSDFLNFIKNMSRIRSVGKRSKEFECGVAQQLHKRVSGDIHRVGHPRDVKKTKKAFNAHLE